MNLIKTVLVDDEPRGLKVLELLTSAYADRLDVVAACTDPQEAINRINDLAPELLIMDIQITNMLFVHSNTVQLTICSNPLMKTSSIKRSPRLLNA